MSLGTKRVRKVIFVIIAILVLSGAIILLEIWRQVSISEKDRFSILRTTQRLTGVLNKSNRTTTNAVVHLVALPETCGFVKPGTPVKFSEKIIGSVAYCYERKVFKRGYLPHIFEFCLD